MTPDQLREHVAWTSATSDGEQLLSCLEVDKFVQDVLDDKLQYVLLIPSWGAQLGALAESLELV